MSALRHSDGAPSTSGLPRQVQSPSACLITCPNLFPRFVHEPSEVFRWPYDVTSAGRHNSAQLETELCKEACEFVAGPLSPAGCDKRRVTTNPPGKQMSSVSLIAVQKYYDCCLVFMPIKLSSAAVAIIAPMPPRLSAICIASPSEMSSSAMWLANASRTLRQ